MTRREQDMLLFRLQDICAGASTSSSLLPPARSLAKMVRLRGCQKCGMSAKLRTTCEMLPGTMATEVESQCGPIESEFFELGGNATVCKAKTILYVNLKKK